MYPRADHSLEDVGLRGGHPFAQLPDELGARLIHVRRAVPGLVEDRPGRCLRIGGYEGNPRGEERREGIEENVAGAVARLSIRTDVPDRGDEEESLWSSDG